MSFNFSIDTSGIESAVKAAKRDVTEGRELALRTSLIPYFIKTVKILGTERELAAEDKEEVAKIVKELAENGWLDESTISWCIRNGIALS